MEKKILLAVDDSIQSKYAVKYAATVFSMVKELHYVLFHVQPSISLYLKDEALKSPKARVELEKVVRKNENSARKMLQQYSQDLVGMGIDEARIEMVTRQQELGPAKDIIEFAHVGRYDAIVMGSKKKTRLEKMFMGSVSATLLEHSEYIPVWIVDGEVASEKILVAVDGSESSFRAVDHISFMLMGNTHVEITLLHVMSKARELIEECILEEPSAELEELVARCDKQQIEEFFRSALKKFRDAGVSENQVKIKTVEGRNRPGRVIIETAKEGNYGTVVIGRRGINKSFFTGSVSHHVINKMSEGALWVVS